MHNHSFPLFVLLKKTYINGGWHCWRECQSMGCFRSRLNQHQRIQRCLIAKWTEYTRGLQERDTKVDSKNDCISTSLQDNLLWVILVTGKVLVPPGFFTCSGYGCNTVSCTVIDCRVLRCQSAQLHTGSAGGFVYSQWGLAIELFIVTSIMIRINMSNLLKAISMTLCHSGHEVVNECVSRSLAENLHWGLRPLQLIPWLLQLDLWVDNCRGKNWMSLSSECISEAQVYSCEPLTCSCCYQEEDDTAPPHGYDLYAQWL